jgi:hypothetical protein
VGQLFDGDGKFVQRFSQTLIPRFQLTSIRGGQVLVPEAVFQIFLIGRSFRDSV